MITQTTTHIIQPDIQVVTITGRLSLGNQLMSMESSIKKMVEDGARKLILDLTELNFCDSAGIGMLVACYSAMEQAGGKLRIAGAQGAAANVFNIVHLERIVPMDKTVDAAAQHFV